MGKFKREFGFCGAGPVGAAGLWVLSLSSTSAGAVPLAFPAEQHLIPLAVGGAFAMPALAALGYVTLCRIGRRLGPVAGVVLGVSLLAVVALAIAAYLQPGLIPFRGS